MTGVDTNIIVRLLTDDDPAQASKAQAVFSKRDIFIPETVMLETEWVLRHAYGFASGTIHSAFTKLCGLPNVILPNPHRMLTALQWYAEGLDFADALHLSACHDCRAFLSFDHKLIIRSTGRGTCRVMEP